MPEDIFFAEQGKGERGNAHPQNKKEEEIRFRPREDALEINPWWSYSLNIVLLCKTLMLPFAL